MDVRLSVTSAREPDTTNWAGMETRVNQSLWDSDQKREWKRYVQWRRGTVEREGSETLNRQHSDWTEHTEHQRWSGPPETQKPVNKAITQANTDFRPTVMLASGGS